MNAIKVMLNELKITTRSPASFMLLLIMPLTMIIMMGFALKPVFQIQEKGIEKFWVLYVNQDSGQIGQAFDAYIKTAGKDIINLVDSNTQDIEGALSSQKLPAAIVVPKGLSDLQSAGEKVQIKIVGSGKDSIREGVVRSLVDGFASAMNTPLGISKGYKDLQIPDKNYEKWIQTSITQRSQGYGSFIKENTVERPASDRVNSFQHYSISMLVFFLLTCGMGLGVSILNDRKARIFMRINSYPVTASHYLLGKTLSNAVLGLIQTIIIVTFTTFAFNIQWSNNFLGLALVILSIISISSGAAIILSSILSSSKALSAVLMVLFWLLTFISGGFAVIPLFDPVSKYTVNKWAFNALSAFIMNDSLQSVAKELILLAATGLALWGIGVALYRRRVICE